MSLRKRPIRFSNLLFLVCRGNRIEVPVTNEEDDNYENEWN